MNNKPLKRFHRGRPGLSSRARTLLDRCQLLVGGEFVNMHGLRELLVAGTIKKYKGAGRKTVNELRALARLPKEKAPPSKTEQRLEGLQAYLTGVVEFDHGVLTDPVTGKQTTPAKLVARMLEDLC